jgi:EpsI family protein
MTRSNRLALVIAALMCGASIGAVVARPDVKEMNSKPAVSLEVIVPKEFGNWREEPQRTLQVVNPQSRELLDKVYSQILERIYINADGYRIMLSLAYASDQRNFRAHYPEACYAAAGFTLHRKEITQLATPFGEIPVGRLLMTRGSREEPLTFWLRIGDTAMLGWQSRLVELGYTLTGQVPDGLLFRVSSIDPNQDRANQKQDEFINQLLKAVSPAERKQLSGLGGS